MAHTFQRISGFKRVITCANCRKRVTVPRDEMRFCEACSKEAFARKKAREEMNEED